MSLYAISVAYILNNISLEVGVRGFTALFLSSLIFWLIISYLHKKLINTSKFSKYIIFFFIAVLIRLVSMIGFIFIRKELVNFSLLYPFLAGMAINIIIIIISNAINSEEQKRIAEKEIYQLQLINLEAQQMFLMQQIHPHFLFNSLSTLKSLISLNQNKAESYTVKLSEFYRYSIQIKDRSLVTLKEELDFSFNYIELQKVRFGDSIIFSMNIPDYLLTYKIPVFSLQFLIENALKHNTFTASNPIKINIESENNILIVSNTKHDASEINTTGIGLNNLKTRYKLLIGKEIEIINNPEYFKVFLSLSK